MGMKRFLIFFILTAFVTVSYAGPNRVGVGWTRSDFRQEQFEKDRKEWIDSIDKNLNSDAFGKALEECLGTKGYYYSQGKYPSDDDQEPISVWDTIAVILILPLKLLFPNL
jgi:hypothetical protein